MVFRSRSARARGLRVAATVLLGLGVGVLGALPGRALVVEGALVGQVNRIGLDQGDRVADRLFGIADADLVGQPVRIDFRLDTELAPPEEGRFRGRRQYSTEGEGPAWLRMSFTMGGRTFEAGGTRAYVDLIHTAPEDPFGVSDSIQFAVELVEDTPERFFRHFIDFRLDIPIGSVPESGFPTAIGPIRPVSQAVNGVTFSYNLFERMPRGGGLSGSLRLNVEVDTVEMAVVPEPGTALLLGLGLTGLAVRPRRVVASVLSAASPDL